MRFVPNRLKVEIVERTPVAFARVGPSIVLIDAGGTLMELPPKHKYSFPVILGMNPGEPLSTRAPRMKVYLRPRSRPRFRGRALFAGSERSESHRSGRREGAGKRSGRGRAGAPRIVRLSCGASKLMRAMCRVAAAVSESGVGRSALRQPDYRESRYPESDESGEASGGDFRGSENAHPRAGEAGSAGNKMPVHAGPHDKPVPKPAFEMTEQKLNSNTAGAKTAGTKTTAKKPAAKANPNAKKPVAKSKAATVPRRQRRKANPRSPPPQRKRIRRRVRLRRRITVKVKPRPRRTNRWRENRCTQA